MKRIVFFVLLAVVSELIFSQNLVVNPGFERWDKSNKPTGWQVAQDCLKDSVYIRSGKYSCRQEGGTKYLGQTLSVSADKKFRFSFFYKTIITGTGKGCRIWCYWKDADGNNLTDITTDDILRPSKYLKSDTWQQFTADFSVPHEASSFYLEIRTYSNSISYFDDVVFEENVATSAPPEELPEIKIFPNPATTYLSICNIGYVKKIEIQSLSGITVLSCRFSGEETVTIPVSDLIDGIYLVRIQMHDILITRKFIKKANDY